MNRFNRRCAAVVSMLVLLSVALSVQAATWRVPGDAASIGGGLALAASGDSVIVAAGTYHEHDLEVSAGVTLRSATGLPECVIIDAQGQGRVISVLGSSMETRVEGFTIQGGTGVTKGCGIHVYRFATLAHLIIRDNKGGSFGGGIYAGSADLEDIIFSDNACEYSGGGVYSDDGQGTWRDLILVGNTARQGSGIAIWQGVNGNKISHVTVVGNHAPPGVTGSAVYVFGEETCLMHYPSIRQSIIAFNEGFGLVFEEIEFPTLLWLEGEMDPLLSSSNVFGNSAGNYSGTIPDLTLWHGNISVDPEFCGSEWGDYHLRAGSPCLPTGNYTRTRMGCLGEGDCTTAIPEEEMAETPSVDALLRNYPNPFNPYTTIAFALAAQGPVRLAVYDISGRLVKTLIADDVRSAGRHEAVWNSRDERGRPVASGIYFYRLEVGNWQDEGKMILLK
ncbi:MAG: T9SS type A sorting domain-containing protein [bacterium]|nr:T9SS type A sorting domain-containing protein [bacterium]